MEDSDEEDEDDDEEDDDDDEVSDMLPWPVPRWGWNQAALMCNSDIRCP